MLRHDDPEFQAFGEVYFSKVFPGVVKAWHIHKKMTLNYYLVVGAIRVALFDDREKSPTKGVFQEVYLEEGQGQLLVVPPLVWNGFKGLGSTPSIVANCSTHAHDPEEIGRKPHDDKYFAYDWSQRHG
jgi:dTDP-4-dehydrorhamnose 3,5-epimerase